MPTEGSRGRKASARIHSANLEMIMIRRIPRVRRSCSLLLTTMLCALTAASPTLAQEDGAGTSPAGLEGLFEIGRVFQDRNGDDFVDFVATGIILGEDRSDAELAAAIDVAARLGFETMAMNLPLARDIPADGVNIQMPIRGRRAGANPFGGFNPRVTIWSGGTEAPDEPAYGDWMKLVASAGLQWDKAVLDYLYEGEHEVERNGAQFWGGAVRLWHHRDRPPEVEEETEVEEDTDLETEPPVGQ